jgi:hypothetical protein
MKVKELPGGGQEITFSKREKLEMDRSIASSYGMTVRRYRAAMKKHMQNDWCSCATPGDPEFCNDGQSRNRHCVSKHHWHCATCGKLVQVG